MATATDDNATEWRVIEIMECKVILSIPLRREAKQMPTKQKPFFPRQWKDFIKNW